MSGRGTKAVHGDAPLEDPFGALNPPVYRTTAFRFESTEDLLAAARGEGHGFYTRYGHPNFERVERKHAALHGAEESVLFASGMGAVAAVLQTLLRAGDRVVVQRDIYGGTRALLGALESRFSVNLAWVPTGDLAALDAALEGARLFLAESPTNPLLKVLDLEATARCCHEHGALFALDATFDGPVNSAPITFGVDLVIESATKSLGGHSDLIAGLVAGSRSETAALRMTRRLFGAVADPETAWLLERGLKTLPARIERQNATAFDLATRLEADARVSGVIHPALASHPQRELILRQAEASGTQGGGAVIAFRCNEGAAAASAFCERVKLIAYAASLGGVESLAVLPFLTSHADFSPEERATAGITDDLVRVSVGLEDVEDLWADIDAALR